MSAVSYASSKCEEFSELIPELDPDGVGLQAPHEEGTCLRVTIFLTTFYSFCNL